MVLGPRFLIEAGFIIAVAVVAGIEELGTWWIIALVAAAWLLVAVFELAWWAAKRRPAKPPVHVERSVPQPPPPTPARPKLVAAAPAEPPREPEREVESQPEAEPVAYLPIGAEPRQWNLWELERAVRDNAGDDVAQNEERAYLLMYLREFAGSDGTLPSDFDGLVRDAFGDMLHSVGT